MKSRSRPFTVQIWEDPKRLPYEFKLKTANSKPKVLNQYKSKYPDAFSISVIAHNGDEELWLNPNYTG